MHVSTVIAIGFVTPVNAITNIITAGQIVTIPSKHIVQALPDHGCVVPAMLVMC